MKRLVKEQLNEIQGFKRGTDPHKQLGIGQVEIVRKTVDSHDLENFSFLLHRDLSYFDTMIEEESMTLEELDDLKYKFNILKDNLMYEGFFDHRESDEMEEFIRESIEGRYVYTAYPGGDGWEVVFSTVELPMAEEIEY